MTNEWLQGYLAALKNIEDATKQFVKDSEDYRRDDISGYKDVLFYIRTVKENYKKLVEELNAKSENKKTSS